MAKRKTPKPATSKPTPATPATASPADVPSNRPDPLDDAETVATRELPPAPERQTRRGRSKAELRKIHAEDAEAFRKESEAAAGELRELLGVMIGIRTDEPPEDTEGLLYPHEANLLCRHGARVLIRRGAGALAEYGDEVIVGAVALGVLVRSIRGWWTEAKETGKETKASDTVADNGSIVRGGPREATPAKGVG